MRNTVQPRLSVVIPAYNASAYVEECLDSVLSQSDCPCFEVVIVDDGSLDETSSIVDARYPKVRLFRKDNGGPGSARNVGVEEAFGEVIVFVDADDVMLPGRLSFQGRFMLENPDIGLTFGNQKFQSRPEFDSNKYQGIATSSDFEVVSNAYEKLLEFGNYIANTTCAVRREAYLKVGGQPTEYFVGEDYKMNCLIARNWPVAASARFLTWYRQGHGQNLMCSEHTYYGPLSALGGELLENGERLNPRLYRRTLNRWSSLLNMYVRWTWIESGGRRARAVLKEQDALLPWWLSLKWNALSFFPSSFGRGARDAVRFVRSARSSSV